MNTKHPITPPEELVEEWGRTVLIDYSDTHWGYEQILCAMAARWGADQELEACCEWFSADAVSEVIDVVSDLRAARRPKPPSLKEQALDQLRRVNAILQFQTTGGETSVIRRALEALDD